MFSVGSWELDCSNKQETKLQCTLQLTMGHLNFHNLPYGTYFGEKKILKCFWLNLKKSVTWIFSSGMVMTYSKIDPWRQNPNLKPSDKCESLADLHMGVMASGTRIRNPQGHCVLRYPPYQPDPKVTKESVVCSP